MDAHMLLHVAGTRMHQVATPHKHVPDFEGQQAGAAVAAAGGAKSARSSR